MRKTNLIFLVFLILEIACNQHVLKKPYLLIPVDSPSGIKALQEKDIAFISGIYTTLNKEISIVVDTTFIIPLSDNKKITATAISVEKSDSSVFWRGYIPGDTMSSVVLTSTGDILSGRIITKDGLFRIAYLRDGFYQVAKLDPVKLMDTLNDADVPVESDTASTFQNLNCSDPISAMDVLVVYTQAAEEGAGGAAGIKSLIDQSVHLTNLCYQMSGVHQRIRLSHSEKIVYTESGNSGTDRKVLQNPSDGIIDEVHIIRKSYFADIVVLIVESLEPGSCGRAFIQENISNSFAPFAFAVVKRHCSADNLTFAHELGHIMGARHTDDPSVFPFAWAHGHEMRGYQTVMSKVPSSIRTTNFSNPSIKWQNDQPTGLAGKSENFKVLNSSAAVVTNFVCKSR